MNNYLSVSEVPIFLHFINREAANAAGKKTDIEEDLTALDVLSICHCSGMSVNISQMSEYSDGNINLVKRILSLCNAKILTLTSHDSNVGEFIASRQTLYHNVAKDYPMYFSDTSTIEKFTINKTNNFSMTSSLKSNILAFNTGELPIFATYATTRDKSIFVENLDIIQETTMKENGIALTRNSFETVTNKSLLGTTALNSFGRILSALYFENYKTQNRQVTCSGISKTGYVEDTFHFPHYDIPVLKKILFCLGWQQLKTNNPNAMYEVYDSYAVTKHTRFVETLNAFLFAIGAHVKQNANKAPLAEEFDDTDRAVLINQIDHILGFNRDLETKAITTIYDFYDNSCECLERSARSYGQKNPIFRTAWEAQMPPKAKTTFLLMTATDSEDQALIRELAVRGFKNTTTVLLGSSYGAKYTNASSTEIIHVRSNAGSTGSSGSELVSSDAIREASPEYVISLGICFGLKDDKQNLGDVLVSEEIIDYEKTRLGEGGTIERGPKIPANPKLLSAAQNIKKSHQGNFTVNSGVILSGMKLFDNEKKRTELIERFPDAIGGEMEGTGLMAAAARENTKWILIKAICDWGYKKGKKEQALAANNASSFVMDMITLIQTAEIPLKKEN